MKEVSPNFKDKADCGCGCGRFGTLRVAAYKSNGVHCVRNCDTTKCPQCRGKASAGRGRKSQAKQAKSSGARNRYHEEDVGMAYRWSHKEDLKHAKVVYRVYDSLLTEDIVRKPTGDFRPFIPTFAQPRRPHLFIVADTPEAKHAFFVQHGFVEGSP